MILPATLRFLADLEVNNDKTWFDANRKAYEAARKNFIAFIDEVIAGLGVTDDTIANINGKDCLFRINRDVRFSKNKAPYKNNFGASINKGGRKSAHQAGYYFHLQPGQSFAGGGIWMPEPAVLNKIRQEIDYNFTEFEEITGNKNFKKVYTKLDDSSEYKLSRPPKGFDADNPAIEYIKLKSYLGIYKVADSELTSKNLVKNTVKSLQALTPLIQFINNATEG